MTTRFPSLLTFATVKAADSYQNSIYKYLADSAIHPEEVENWRKIGSLVEALARGEDEDSTGPVLDESFVRFFVEAPLENTPRPFIRKRMQRSPQV
jgi:hypothetical protein